MSVRKIVHISPTPLVGSPGKIAEAQRSVGHDSVAVVLSDYPKNGPLEKLFLSRSILLDEFTKPHIENLIRDCNIIHVHNFLNARDWVWLRNLTQTATFVHHAHSPTREGPLYVDRATCDPNFEFDLRLVVGQHWDRFYPDAYPVPNLILTKPSIRLRKPNERLRVMFSPTHKHVGRWTSKHSEALDTALASLSDIGKIDLLMPSAPVQPETLFELRRGCHVTIDEIATGGFHMVSLEGLCAGNVVINKADYFSRSTFANFCENVMPPFTEANDNDIADILMELADDVDLTVKKQKMSIEYFKRYCGPTRLVGIFDEAYDRVC